MGLMSTALWLATAAVGWEAAPPTKHHPDSAQILAQKLAAMAKVETDKGDVGSCTISPCSVTTAECAEVQRVFPMLAAKTEGY